MLAVPVCPVVDPSPPSTLPQPPVPGPVVPVWGMAGRDGGTWTSSRSSRVILILLGSSDMGEDWGSRGLEISHSGGSPDGGGGKALESSSGEVSDSGSILGDSCSTGVSSGCSCFSAELDSPVGEGEAVEAVVAASIGEFAVALGEEGSTGPFR